jgi:MFS family permease
MVLKAFLSGVFVKIITGFDDTITHLPIMSTLTKTRRGRIAFALGILLAISLAILFSYLFASAIKLLPFYRYISAGIIFLLAVLIYFEILVSKPREKVEKKLKKQPPIAFKRIFKLVGLGFLAALATVVDDTIVYSSLFLGSISNSIYAIIGIFFATILELILIIYFAKKVAKIKWKKEIVAIGLIILGILILLRVL